MIIDPTKEVKVVVSKEDQFTAAICLDPVNICEYSQDIQTDLPLFEADYVTKRGGKFLSLLVQCARSDGNATLSVSTTGRYTLSFTNTGLFFFRFLQVVERHNAYVRFSFCLLWIILLLVWIVTQYRIPKLGFHSLITSIATSRLLFLISALAYNVYFGNIGRLDNWGIVHVPDLFVGVNLFLLFSFLALISKGYNIMRISLAPVEVRSIVFVGMSMGIGEALFSYTGMYFTILTKYQGRLFSLRYSLLRLLSTCFNK
jgi:hypothetical protein